LNSGVRKRPRALTHRLTYVTSKT